MVDIPCAVANSPECEQAAEKAHQLVVSGLERHGITLDFLAEKLKRELCALEIRVFKGSTGLGQGVDGKAKAVEGLIYSNPLIAWKVRQEARKDAHKLLGHYPQGEANLDERPILVIMPKVKVEAAK